MLSPVVIGLSSLLIISLWTYFQGIIYEVENYQTKAEQEALTEIAVKNKTGIY